jgi:hypothetical protein
MSRKDYWLSGAEAKQRFGVSPAALYMRVRRGAQLRTTRSGPGRGVLLYWVPDLVLWYG